MCTILKMKKGNIIGKNYDALIETGMIFTNKRGIQKSALIMPPALQLKWESVYGSLSKNVEEAIEAFNKCAIEAHSWPIHFILADEKDHAFIRCEYDHTIYCRSSSKI